MLPNRYAFINESGTVVQVIVGALNAQQQQQFLQAYAALFGAAQIVAVDEGTAVWIGGTYTDGVFMAPPQPEPVPEPEPIAEPEAL